MALGWRGQYVRYREFFLNIMLVYKNRPDLKMFLEILLSLGTVSFFTLFALKPTAATIAQLLKDIRSKEATIAKMDQKIQNIASAQSFFSREEARIPAVNFSVPNNPSLETFVRQIEGLSAESGVRLLGVSVGEVTLLGEDKVKSADSELPSLPEGSKGLSFSLSVAGDYPALNNFVSKLEQFRRPIKTDTAGVTVSKTETGKILLLVVSGRTPYLGKNK